MEASAVISAFSATLVILLASSSASLPCQALQVPALWPKELDGALAQYESRELLEQLIAYLNLPKSAPPMSQAKAVRFLLDLRNDDITLWVLTKSPAAEIALTELQERKKMTLPDALPIARAMARTALPEAHPDGEVAAGKVALLGQAFRRCLRQGPNAVPWRGELRAEILMWMLLATDRAIADATTDKQRLAELQRLREYLIRL